MSLERINRRAIKTRSGLRDSVRMLWSGNAFPYRQQLAKQVTGCNWITGFSGPSSLPSAQRASK